MSDTIDGLAAPPRPTPPAGRRTAADQGGVEGAARGLGRDVHGARRLDDGPAGRDRHERRGPNITSSLHASQAAYQWINTGYALSFSVLLIAGGRLGDIVGRRRMFIMGLTGFVIMSALCVVAQNAGELITFRLLQGAASAMMIPQGIGMIREAFGREGSQKAFTIFGPFMGMSAMLGPILGGMLITWANWRWVFVINLPIGLVALFFAGRVLPEGAPQRGRHAEAGRRRPDPVLGRGRPCWSTRSSRAARRAGRPWIF